MEKPAVPEKPNARDISTGGGVTMSTIGRLAGVSQVTVSRALSNPSKVSPQTLERIHAAIRQTGYVPNALAGALASRRSRLITALVPSITNIVYATLLHGFSQIMREQGYQIMLAECGFDPEDEEKLISAMLSRRPDGMLLTGIHHTAASRRILLGAEIPVVEIWDVTETPIDFCVGFSHLDAGRAVADFAVKTGHKRALTITASDERAHRRRMAFSEAFQKSGGDQVLRVDCDGAASLGIGREAFSKAVTEQGFMDGVVFCSSDLLAQGVLIEAQSRGLSIPKQVSVIGFGDQDFAAVVEPALTTVRVDRHEFGRVAAAQMQKRILGETLERPVIDLGFEIVRRASA